MVTEIMKGCMGQGMNKRLNQGWLHLLNKLIEISDSQLDKLPVDQNKKNG